MVSNCQSQKQAGNDMLEIRRKYLELRILGGFDKNVLFKSKEHIDKELEEIPYLISKGGFIPECGHLVLPNSTWENYKYYCNKIKDIILSTKVLS
jgi:hypothetical protein